MNIQEQLKALTDFYVSMDEEEYIKICSDVMSVNTDTLAQELGLQAIRYSHYNYLVVKAEYALNKEEAQLELISAQKRKEFKITQGKATAKDLDDLVNSSEEYQEQKGRYIESKRRHHIMKTIVKALEQKKDMLVQLSAQQRAETKIY